MLLVINCGSSSLKYKLFDAKLKPVASGLNERVNGDYAAALSAAFSDLKKQGFDVRDVRAVGHRVVHGGAAFVAPTKIDARVIAKLKELYALAPLHNPPNVLGIEASMKLLPGVPNVAVFDTALYRDLPDYAYMYALPYDLYEKHGIRKYGFHGISHGYVASEAAKKLKKPLSKLKLVTCHLGSGASVTAMKNGKAVDTSMGFTPLEGLTMSTRCGDIDPEIPLWLIRTLKMTPEQVDDLLNKKSGWLGLTGMSDLRDVIAKAEKGEKRSKLALEMFAYDVVRYIGQFMTVMGGCDAVVFTAGVGERSEKIRSMITRWLKPFKLKALVVPTDEERMIARETAEALK
ncbi:MAG: acetate/propionate family kinase [Patescibacteria group bacterium]|nr:MAG: acetate/propionate family kinase [Patescibacteria group bacterium]